ncbi:MAG: ribosomal protein L1 [Psychrosphaera sp.]|jgi:ribosomal protein L1
MAGIIPQTKSDTVYNFDINRDIQSVKEGVIEVRSLLLNNPSVYL